MSQTESMNISKFGALIREFYSATDQRMAMLKMFKEICMTFKIDRLTVIARNDDLGKYLMMYEFDSEKGFLNHSQEMNIELYECVNTLYNTSDNDRQIFRLLCNAENYIYTENYSGIQKELENVGFKPKNSDSIKELYVYLATCTHLFTYTTFERYSDEKLSETDMDIITTACKIIDTGINIMVEKRKTGNSILLKDTLLNHEEIPMAVIEKDTFKVLHHNEFYYNIFPAIEVGEICYELIGNKGKCSECCIDKDVLLNSENSEKQWIKKAIPLKLTNGKDAYMIYAKDNTDYVNQLKATDNLTGALLFRGFEEYYNNFIQRSNETYALCSLDIDKFKYVNSSFGYDVGNEVLRNIAKVLRNFVKTHENFCRIGEDKFSLFLQYDDEVQLHSKIKSLTSKFIKMKDIYFPETRIAVIGGVTLVSKELNIYNLLDQSTTARKSAKGSHESRFSYYDPNLDAKIKKEIRIEEMIPYALANKEFVPYLQPKFNLTTMKICGAEALVRWETATGMIYPDEFIPLFEQNGFIVTLDFIMYDKVMEFIRKCLDQKLPVYPISLNVSRNHIGTKDFLKKFIALVKKYQIPREYLELEITESVFVEDKQVLKEFINAIKKQKLKTSIDDFGTAYSSLQTLTDINVDILKIDKGFLDNIVIDEYEYESKNEVLTKNVILIKNIINLAKELEFKVICEGIENDGQIELLKSIGCELGQGYVFAKPMPISEYTEKYIN